MLESGQTPPSLDLFATYLVDRPTTLTDYLAADSLVIVDEPSAVELVASQLERQASELRDAFVANGELPAGLRSPIAPWSRVRKALSARRSYCRLALLLTANRCRLKPSRSSTHPGLPVAWTMCWQDVRLRLADGWRIAIATDQVDRLTELFEEQDIFPRRDRRRDASAAPLPLHPGHSRFGHRISTAAGPLRNRSSFSSPTWRSSGFASRPAAHRRRHAESGPLAAALSPGDYVVHVDYGVGIFRGLVRLETGGLNASTSTSITPRATASMFQSIRPTASPAIQAAASTRP